MKKFWILSCLLFSFWLQAQYNYDLEWKKIEQKFADGNVKSTIPLLKNFEKNSLHNQNFLEHYRAFMLRLEMEKKVLEESSDEDIDNPNYALEILKTSEEQSAVYKEILRFAYLKQLMLYYDDNEYEIRDRTDVADKPKLISEWSRRHFKEEFNHQFELLFEAKNELANESIDVWNKPLSDEIENEENIKNISILHDIIDAYNEFSNEYSFYFSSEEREKLKQTYSELQEFLLQKYLQNNAIDAYLYTYTEFLDEKDLNPAENQKEIEQLIGKFQTEFNAQLLYLLAKTYTKLGDKKNDYVQAKKIAQSAIDQYPKSIWKVNAENLIKTIEYQEANIEFPQNALANEWIPIHIEHRNVNKLYVRLYNISQKPTHFVDFSEHEDKNDDEKAQTYFTLQAPIIRTQTIDLQQFTDYKDHSTWYKLQGLPAGTYTLVISNNPDFIEDKNSLFVKQNSYTIREHMAISGITEQGNVRKLSVQLVHADTGNPLGFTKVELYELHENNYIRIESFTTNDVGEFSYDFSENAESYYYRFIRNKYVFIPKTQEFISLASVTDHQYIAQNKEETYRTKAEIFIDRAIYRPSQTIYFKAIVYETYTSQSKIATQKTFRAELQNVNGEVVSKLDNLISNDFGSFHAQFIIPTSGLTGNYSIHIYDEKGKKIANESIKVEEYKRPKFEVSFKPLTDEYQLNTEVKATGIANAFSGANITDARVEYRIVRKEIFPFPVWNGYRYYVPNRYSSEEPISKGKTTTNEKGEFEIAFKTEIKESKFTEKTLTYAYKIYADVTDVNGETHSNSITLHAGNIPKKLSIQSKESYIDTETETSSIAIISKNLNDKNVASKGTYSITKLVAPNRLVTPNSFTRNVDYQLIPEEVFEDFFPNLNYKANTTDVTNWKKGEIIVESTFQNKAEDKDKADFGTINLPKLTQGNYLIETQERFGNDTIRAFQYIKVFHNQTLKVEQNEYFTAKLDKISYKVGETAKLIFSTDTKAALLYYALEMKETLSDKKMLAFQNGQAVLEVPITTENQDGIFIHYFFVQFNDGSEGKLQIPIEKTIPSLEITTEVFRDEVDTGKPEVWKLKITGKDKEKVTAEVLATMYDQSLDEFASHSYYFSPFKYQYFSRYEAFYSTSFRNQLQELYSHTYRQSICCNSYPSFSEFTTDFEDYYYDFESSAYEEFLKSKGKRSKKNTSGSSSSNVPPPPPAPKAIPQEKMAKFITPKVVHNANVMKKEELTGSIAVIDDKAIQDVDFVNSGKSLNGSVSGLNVSIGYGQPGSGANEVLLRGQNSVNGNNKALIIIDGIAYSGDVNSLNAEDFANVEVLKDASATAIYGSKAANGVIVITTKEAARKAFEQVTIRKNLQETAFFYPELKTDSVGNIIIEFTTPEALSRWKVLLLAHTKDLAVGTKTLEVKTQKELMVVPNVPRFLREKDSIILSSKITNLSDKMLQGNATIQFFDAFSMKNIDEKFKLTQNIQAFTIAQGQNKALSWKVEIPEGIGAVVYRVIASTKTFSDGEENVVPILTNRMLVIETIPISVREGQTKTYEFTNLKNNTSSSLRTQSLTLDINTNPIWLAVSSLPYLREFPYECSEQLFSRLYGNMLSTYIIQSQPKIKNVFDIWNKKEVNKSKLELNQELKNILLEETPWLRDAQSETQRMKQLAVFYDLNTMQNELKQAKNKLIARQSSNGSFVWFDGGEPDLRITQHIVSGFGKLKKMTGESYQTILGEDGNRVVEKAIEYIDSEISNRFNSESKSKTPIYTNYEFIQYVYARSFWLKEFPMKASQKNMITTIISESIKQKSWNNLQSKAQFAVILNRYGYVPEAKKVILQLKETAVESTEKGMYWKENVAGWYWYDSPIETQSMLLEAFHEVTPNDVESIEGMKVWLIKNKQNNAWESTKATTDAVYALLHTGKSWTNSEDNVQIQTEVFSIPTDELAQAGFIKTTISGNEIQADKTAVTISKSSAGVVLGGMYWNYFEELDKIKSPQQGMYLKKELYLKKNTDQGLQLQPITENQSIQVGDLVTIRLVIKVDRDLEYIHIKDMRASGFEPVNVLSGYKRNSSFGYYESTRDAATNFFISYLPKGSYVFEYDVRANNAGNFSNGITTLQNMYAPEMSAHSEGIRVEIK